MISSLLCSLLALSVTTQASTTSKVYLDPTVESFLNDDKSTGALSVIVVFKKADKQFSRLKGSSFQQAMMGITQKNISALKQNKNLNFRSSHYPLWILNGMVAELSQNEILNLSQNTEIDSITFGKKVIKVNASADQFSTKAAPDSTYGLKNIKVPELRAKYPHLTGKGVVVGMLDTGIVTNHPDLKGKLLRFKNFSPAQDTLPKDEFGHGTHVAGTINGGATSGLAIGVAPEAQMIVGRIFDRNGSSTKEDILKAMQWMADPDENPATNDRPVAVNNSWGDDEAYRDRDPQDDPFCKVVDSWVALGIVPVFTAGNTGPRDETINTPGACPNSLTVGATEMYDRSPHFSSSGPTTWKTVKIIKPDVVAPGVDIKSAGRFGDYEKMSGTSMAAPHVTGALALLFQAYPQLTVDQAVKAMAAGVKDLGTPGKDNTFGSGRIDILKSIELLTTNPAVR